MKRPLTWQRVVSGIKAHAMEIASHICDAFTLIGVVILQDIFLMEATAMCLAASLLSLLFNGLAWRQGRRKVYPKTIDVAVPLLFVGLLPPAILYTEVTHRYVFLAINGWLLAVMTFSVLRRRPFTWEYMAEMFPPSTWDHPLLRRAGYTAALAWMASLATMLGAAVATATLQLKGFDVTAIMVNYVLQLVPLLLVIGWSIWYVIHTKRCMAAVMTQDAAAAAAAAAAEEDNDPSEEGAAAGASCIDDAHMYHGKGAGALPLAQLPSSRPGTGVGSSSSRAALSDVQVDMRNGSSTSSLGLLPGPLGEAGAGSSRHSSVVAGSGAPPGSPSIAGLKKRGGIGHAYGEEA